MPFVLLALGLLLFVVALQGTQNDFASLLKSEFTGSNSFVVWASAFIILGLLGYIRPIRPITHAFLVLLLLVLILTNGKGFVSQFNAAIRSPVAPAGSDTMTAAGTSLIGAAQAAGTGQSGSGGFLGAALPDVLSGGYGGASAGTGAGSDTLIPDYDANGQWIGYTRP